MNKQWLLEILLNYELLGLNLILWSLTLFFLWNTSILHYLIVLYINIFGCSFLQFSQQLLQCLKSIKQLNTPPPIRITRLKKPQVVISILIDWVHPGLGIRVLSLRYLILIGVQQQVFDLLLPLSHTLLGLLFTAVLRLMLHKEFSETN